MTANKFNFTKTSIAGIPIPKPGQRTRVYDSKTRGLLVDVTSSGSKTFYLRRKKGGKSSWEKIGSCSDVSVEQAREQAYAFNSELAKGIDISAARLQHRDELTLAQLFSEYIERHAKKTRKTWAAMEKDFARYATPLSNKKLSAISHAEAEKLHGALARERGTYTANRTVQLLKAVYNKGKAYKLYSGDNPFEGISLFTEQPRNRFLDVTEVGSLLRALAAETNADLKHFITLSLLTGVRKSNLLAMRWQDINWTVGTWLIPDTKNGTEQIVTLGEYEVEILKGRIALLKSSGVVSPYVFPGDGRTGHLMDPKKSWTRLRASAGLEDCTIHDLRRSLAAGMASNNVNVALIKSALNHKDMKTTMNVYARTAKTAELAARELVHKTWFEAADAGVVEVAVPFPRKEKRG